MASTILWLGVIALECVPLLRAAEAKFIKCYKLFYLYLAVVLARDLCLLGVYFFWPRFYGYAYWGSEPVSVLMGCGLVWEVYRIAFARYPGASRVARSVLLFLFIIAITRILVQVWNSPTWTPGRTTLEAELNLRAVQTVLLAGLVALFAYYAIPLGRNLKGIIYGYGFFLATRLVNLTLRDYLGDSFQHLWQYIQPACYALVLLVWCGTLWSYAPVPDPELEPGLESDYQALIKATRAKFRSAYTRILKDIRS